MNLPSSPKYHSTTMRSWMPRAFLALSAGLSFGCSATSQQSDVLELGGLDTNGDGLLTDEDLEPGQAAIYLSYWAPGSSGEPVEIRHVAEQPRMFFDEGQIMCPPGWGLRVQVTDSNVEQDFFVQFWFADTDPANAEMSVGQGDIELVGVDIPSLEQGGEARGPFEAPMRISESTGATSSGRHEGDVNIEVAYYSPGTTPTGERFLIHSVAFRDIRTAVPLDVVSVDECLNTSSTSECQAVYNGDCFPTIADACSAAGCAANGCQIAESLPPQISCT